MFSFLCVLHIILVLKRDKMASIRVEPIMASSVASTSLLHSGSNGVDQLPKELHEMKLQDNRSDRSDNEKVSNIST